ncbi:glycoside hydrolase superfamily [Phaeosphaeriaceae sp. PMI808]|nr:glycoside hydrolase superfamily [Phaeosphaeriaceae sp. PMI808]
MKTVILMSALAAGVLVGTAKGRPLLDKRAIVTEVVYVTDVVANVLVYVDETGAPYLTSTEAKATSTFSSVVIFTTSIVAQPALESTQALSISSSLATPVPSIAPVPSALPPIDIPASSVGPSIDINPSAPSVTAPTPPSPAPEKAKVTTTTPVSAPTSEQPAPPPPALSSATPAVPVVKEESGDSLGMGVTYDPFKGSSSNSDCKTKDEIANDFDRMASYKAVRIYGQGCDIIPNAVKNVVKHKQKLMAGVYLTTRGNGESMEEVIKTLKTAIDTHANGDWSIVSLFSVENERVNDHDMTASAVVDAIKTGRDQLRKLGYNGPVGAVETVPATLDNPSICETSDVVMVNCHAFFDINTQAKDAGSFVKSQVDIVKQACKNKRVVVTESGWPHKGNTNGEAIPSPENQRAAIESIRSQFSQDIFLHNAFDSTWKSDWAASFNAERFWGIIQ